MILCDTDVIINFLKGQEITKKSFLDIGYENISISSVTLMELYYGAFNKKEIQLIKKSLLQLPLLKLNENISEIATALIEKYSKSHNLQIPDALIASTALCNNISLFTYNIKDYKFIEEINLFEPIK